MLYFGLFCKILRWSDRITSTIWQWKKSNLFSWWFDTVDLDSMVVSLISELAGELDKSGNSATSLGSKGSTVVKNSKSGLVESKSVKSLFMSRNFLENVVHCVHQFVTISAIVRFKFSPQFIYSRVRNKRSPLNKCSPWKIWLK